MGRHRGRRGVPEQSASRPVDYWQKGNANHYHNVRSAARLQAELTQSVAALGDLPYGPALVLDLGCGGGLSTVAFHALAAASGVQGGPPFIIGLDTSRDMLVSQCAGALDFSGICMQPTWGDETGTLIPADTGVQWKDARSDMLLADISQPLPFRPGIVDGAFSVSAVQWLIDPREIEVASGGANDGSQIGSSSASSNVCDRATAQANHEDTPIAFTMSGLSPHEPKQQQPRLSRLFRSLHFVSVPGALTAMQFYPPKGDADFGARCLVDASTAEGFSAEVVLDYPHSDGKSRKWVLVVQRSMGRTACKHAGTQDETVTPSPAWCALCWPVVTARCALQRRMPGSSREGQVCAAIRSRLEQQHLQVALRLARTGRRLLQQPREIDEICKEQAEQVRKRLEKDMHPLQFDMAVVLAEFLIKCETSEDQSECAAEQQQAASNQIEDHVVKKPRTDAAFGTDPAAPPKAKAEFRATIVARFQEVLGLLHSCPSERWMHPPPPLGSGVQEHAETIL